jgi:hypothetical protein
MLPAIDNKSRAAKRVKKGEEGRKGTKSDRGDGAVNNRAKRFGSREGDNEKEKNSVERETGSSGVCKK